MAETETDKRAHLLESEMFEGLSAKDMDTVEELTTVTRCERGRIFFRPEDVPETIYILKEGRIRLYRETEDGRQLTVGVLDPGSVFGESTLLGQNMSGVYARAEEEGLLCVMRSDHLRQLIERVPQIGLNLLQHVGTMARASQELAEQVAYWPVARRLAKQLLELADRYGRPTLDGNTIIDHAITQAEIADLVGSTRETVASLLGTFRANGIITNRGRKIIVVDRMGLEARAQSQAS